MNDDVIESIPVRSEFSFIDDEKHIYAGKRCPS